MEANSYNYWRETIKFFNSKIGQEVKRQELLRAVEHSDLKHRPLTTDTYKGILMRAGYLKYIARGKYFVKKQIPDVSLTLMREYVYTNKPMGWFKFWGGLEEYLKHQEEK